MAPLEADQILVCLERHGVRYVVIGGIAAILHGSPQVTFDADICPARDPSNLEALASSLREMKARIRAPDVPEGLPFACDATFLASVSLLNLVTQFGELDLSFTPSGTGGYADLIARAVRMSIQGSTVPVAALEDVIRSKEAANRPKDQRTLPLLRQLLAEIRAREGRKG
jgi:hypothetical protein